MRLLADGLETRQSGIPQDRAHGESRSGTPAEP
jgi:hypothetical protein